MHRKGEGMKMRCPGVVLGEPIRVRVLRGGRRNPTKLIVYFRPAGKTDA